MSNQPQIQSDQRALVRQVLTFPNKLRDVSFPLLVKESTGFDVIPIDRDNDYDKNLVLNLETKLLGSLKAIGKSGQYFRGNRINDVGSQIEMYFVRDLNTPPFSVTQLIKKGYPDVEVTFENEPIYMELKTSGAAGKSSYRYFYYSTGVKVKKAARHILLSIITESSDRGYWTVKSFVISDLSRLKVRLKAEFNATKTDLMNEESRIAIVP
jgi:hypothetical protein